MSHDRNLLFGVLALQADLINSNQFADICTAWAARKQSSLADLLVERGWLSSEDCADVEKLVRRKLKKHAGDARAGLAEAATLDPVRHSLAGIADPDVRHSLAGVPPGPRPVMPSTIAAIAETRDRYRLTQLHATGGLGRVWLARDGNLGRDVALKELLPERAGQPIVADRFLKEARITGQLEHPGIVPVYELGFRPDDRVPFYTMRFLRGRTLSEAIKEFHQKRQRLEQDNLGLRLLLHAFLGVCQAVAYAHSRGVIHRDLKPTNVVLGDFGEAIVLDWGLAKLVNDDTDQPDRPEPVNLPAVESADATLEGQVLGTPAYMSPEQAEGRLDLVGPASDIYGLGAILYELLTGKPPFAGTEPTEVIRQVIHLSPPRPRDVNPSAPVALEAVCLKAMMRRPSDRYASAAVVADDIQRFLADEPVTAMRPPLRDRARRWARRNRPLVSALAAMLAVAFAALVVGAILIGREQSRTADALRQAKANLGIADQQRQRADEQKELAEKRLVEAEQNLGVAAFALNLSALVRSDPAAEGKAMRAEMDRDPALKDVMQKFSPMARGIISVMTEKTTANLPPAMQYRNRLSAAAVTLQLGIFLREMGLMDPSTQLFVECQSILVKLMKENPQDVLVLNAIADVNNHLGYNEGQSGRTQEAIELHRQTRDIFKLLPGMDAGKTAYYRDMEAEAAIQLGFDYKASKDLANAEVALRDAARIRRELMAELPYDSHRRDRWLEAQSRLIDFLSENQRDANHLAALEEALAVREAALNVPPETPAYAAQSIDTLFIATSAWIKLKKTDVALASWERVVRKVESLVPLYPKHADLPAYRSRAYMGRATILHEMARFHEAVADWTRAIEFDPGTSRSVLFVNRANSRVRLNDDAGALADVAEATKSKDAQVEVTLSAARIMTTISQRGQDKAKNELLAVQAVGYLRKALERGHFKEAGNVDALKLDADLMPLKGRADYKNLLGEIEAQAKKP